MNVHETMIARSRREASDTIRLNDSCEDSLDVQCQIRIFRTHSAQSAPLAASKRSS
jgi:hypothetical protein